MQNINISTSVKVTNSPATETSRLDFISIIHLSESHKASGGEADSYTEGP